ncbi:hypothetical protein [Xanthomonas dyei]|uniref:hypothetical protein n=1 Tax=Xanthomonas dyei TaxID=743699 RepID=UPI001E40416F|nr:hypothetical protein [Xanthomonas dyei]MCC4635774.1 hypothetical protein [Xanthomonas dyei pv. eucalypti]
MFGFFKRKQTSPPLHFKDGDSAFSFACTISKTDVSLGDTIPALVVSLSNVNDKGLLAQIIFASPDGGRPAICPVADSVAPLKPGDLVAFKVFEVNPDLNSVVGVLGGVVARLGPEFIVDRGWKIDNPAPV